LKEKRQLSRLVLRREDNIKMDLSEIWYEGMDCIPLAQDKDKWPAFMNTVMNLRVSTKGPKRL
jgi:hypothetical protein